MENGLKEVDGAFIDDLRHIVAECRQRAYFAVNAAQVTMNWLIGRRIVEQEQGGNNRAEYGKYIIKLASESLTAAFGKGFSETNLRSFRKFYTEYKDFKIQQTVSAISQNIIQQTMPAESISTIGQKASDLLPWSHYERLMRVENLNARR